MIFPEKLSRMPEQFPHSNSASRRSGGLFDLLVWLPEPARQTFADAVHPRRYSPGQIIYSTGDAANEMFRIVAGMVRLSVLRDDGREMVYGLLHSGDCFGAHDLVRGGCRTHMAEAEDKVEVQVLSRQAFHALRLAHRAFDDALLRLLAGGIELLGTYLAAATFDELPNRLAQRLLDTARPDAAKRLAVRVPQTELALMIGVSRQTVNKILRQFETAGVVSLGYGSVIIRDPGALADRAGQVPAQLSAA